MPRFPSGSNSDTVDNVSTVNGSTVTDALDTLAGLTSPTDLQAAYDAGNGIVLSGGLAVEIRNDVGDPLVPLLGVLDNAGTTEIFKVNTDGIVSDAARANLGDIAVGTGANNALAILSGGNAGEVLTADPTIPLLGMGWAAPAGGGEIRSIDNDSVIYPDSTVSMSYGSGYGLLSFRDSTSNLDRLQPGRSLYQECTSGSLSAYIDNTATSSYPFNLNYWDTEIEHTFRVNNLGMSFAFGFSINPKNTIRGLTSYRCVAVAFKPSISPNITFRSKTNVDANEDYDTGVVCTINTTYTISVKTNKTSVVFELKNEAGTTIAGPYTRVLTFIAESKSVALGIYYDGSTSRVNHYGGKIKVRGA